MMTTQHEGRAGQAGRREERAAAAAGGDTMQAIVQRRYGTIPRDVLRTGLIARPEIEADEVLVRVHAAGVDRGTWHLMAGQPMLMRLIGFGFARPKHPV